MNLTGTWWKIDVGLKDDRVLVPEYNQIISPLNSTLEDLLVLRHALGRTVFDAATLVAG